MEISVNNIDNQNAILKVKVGKGDYEEKINKSLKDYQKKATLKGFRPGKAPMSLIEKMYRKPILVEEINKIVGQGIDDHLKKENIQILGDPMPLDNQINKPINWDEETEFEFSFELGLTPTIDITVSDKDKIDYFSIKMEDKMIEDATTNYQRRYGKFVDCDVVEGNEMIKAKVTEKKEGGVSIEETSMMLEMIKDEDIKKKFVGLKAGDQLTIDLKKAYPNDHEIAGMLKIKKEEVETLATDFEVTINIISRFEKAEINQHLFDLMYGENIVTSEEEFKKRIVDDIRTSLDSESDYKFQIDAKKYFIEKTKAELPKDFLIRWMEASNEGKFTREQIENEYPMFEDNLKWQLLRNKIVKDAEIKIDDNDVKAKAKETAMRQFRQYGIFNVTDDYLEDYAGQMLKRQEDVKHILDAVLEEKVFAHLKESVKLNKKELSVEEFNKMFEQ